MTQNFSTFANDLASDEGGTALLEYSILLGIISLAAVTAAVAVGGWVGPKWKTFCNALPGITGCP